MADHKHKNTHKNRSRAEMRRLFNSPKAHSVMREFSQGRLKHGGTGRTVTDLQVAHAIAMSEAESHHKRKKK